MAKTYTIQRRGNVTFRQATRCIFCGSPGPLTDEHVFSRWTHRFLPPRSMKKYHVLRAETYIEKSDRFLFKRAGDIRDWQIECVCERRCNNGWMRQNIEDRARPIMIPLITGQPARILPEQQRVIAAWAVLKAMVAEYDRHGWVTTHHMQRKRLMRTLLPPERGWVVWIGHYARSRWVPFWGSSPFLYLSKQQERRARADVRATHFNSHISTQVVGQLFIHVIRSPARSFVEGWRFSTPDKGALLRIWPPGGASIAWPGRTMTDRDADYAATSLKTFLEDRARAALGAKG
jgi:hypothetical protein